AQPVDHPYFPLTASATRVYVGSEDGEPIDARFELTNLGPGPVIAGVQTQVQRDRDYEDGLLVEETFDYYAQDTEGNVWYLGEDVTNFEYDDDGNLIGTNDESAWRAGVNDALPGLIMPADPDPEFNYYQEFAPEDDALDQATIFGFLDMLEMESGIFEDVLQIFETNELEPDAREFKYYAPGFGLILVEEDLNEDLQDPEAVFALAEETESVPEPGTLGLLLLALGALTHSRLRHMRGSR
ncbi:MAG TPA: PEP-CTERM sorting domain-containing protein, partial [Steroidobacteraceae bacterium]|nr:PEP-CTERM sorting domain-containing protein [Steroidobacteraceae bacterium]